MLKIGNWKPTTLHFFLIPGFFLLIFLVAYGALTYIKFHYGLYNGLDLAIFNQIFWNTTNGSFFGLTIHPHISLGDHMELLILLLAPIYTVFQHPYTLLVLQGLALGGTAYAFVWIIRERAGSNWLSLTLGTMLSIFWFVSPLMHSAAMFEFHIYVFAAPIVAFAYVAYIKKNYRWFIILFFLLLLVREDVSLVAGAFALLALLSRRSWKWWLPTGIIATAWFFASTAISGLLNPGGNYKFYSFYSELGDNPLQIGLYILTHPIELLKKFLSPQALKSMNLLFGSSGYLSVLAPWALIIALPVFIIQGIGADGFGDATIAAHYHILMLTAIFLSSAEALGWIARFIKKRFSKLPTVRRTLVFSLILLIGLTGVIQTGLTYSMSPFAEHPARKYVYRIAQHTPEILERFLSQISPEDSVMASTDYLTYVSGREEVYSMHYTYVGVQQFSTEPFPEPDVDVAIIDTEEILRIKTAAVIEAWSTPGAITGSPRLRDYLDRHDLKPKDHFDTTILFTKDGDLDLYSEKEAELSSQRISSTSVYECDNTICLDVITEIPKDTKNILLRLSYEKDGKTNWDSFYLPAYGFVMAEDLESDTIVETHFRLATPYLMNGNYDLRLSMELLEGHHALSVLKTAVFVPVPEPTVIDSQMIGELYVLDGIASVSSQ